MAYQIDSDAYHKLSVALENLEQDTLLFQDDSFVERIDALDFLELELLGNSEFEQEPDTTSTNAGVLTLIGRAQVLNQKLEDANNRLWSRLLTAIRSNDRGLLKQYLAKFERQVSTWNAQSNDQTYVGYDEIDSLLWGLLEVDLIPEEPKPLEPDMVYYQPSGTRTILKLIRELQFYDDDIFYDLGSGLGHVPILVNLLTNIKTKGIEIQEFYCRYSNECLHKLALSNTEFINADARNADYDDGTIFYMYTPFRGKVLQHVLGKLEVQAKRRQIRVCTYGPCTADVAEQTQAWLQPTYQKGAKGHVLGIFTSF